MKLRSLYSKPGTWTQCALARTADGKGVMSDHPNAVSFCLVGAICRFYPGRTAEIIQLLEKDKAVAPRDIVAWNNAPSRTQREVMNLCRRLGL